MFTRRPSLQAREPRERIWLTDPEVPSRACCCPARPAVKIVMPPLPGRDRPVDLWLCRHHYRVSSAVLGAFGVIAEGIASMDEPTSEAVLSSSGEGR